MNNFIPKEILDELSYISTLGQSLKQISLSKTPIDRIIQNIGRYRTNYVDILVQENLIGSNSKVMIPYTENLRKHFVIKAALNNVSMIF